MTPKAQLDRLILAMPGQVTARKLLEAMAKVGLVVEPVEEARLPFYSVFLDGRNEYGSHVLQLPGDSICDARHISLIQDTLDDQSEGLAEKIISQAEGLGFSINHAIVTIWKHVNDSGEPGHDYFEYVRISPILTNILFGSAEEQNAELAIAAGDIREEG